MHPVRIQQQHEVPINPEVDSNTINFTTHKCTVL